MFGSDQRKLNLPQHFAYKLDISVTPYWPVIADKLSASANIKNLEERHAKYKKAGEDTIFGRYYHFTEYYDSASGLTIRQQSQSSSKGRSHNWPVDEFLDYGYVFGTNFGSEVDHEEENNWSIEITEDSIRNNCFDKYVGGHSSIGSKEDYMVIFPVNQILTFLLEIGLRFYDVEDNTVIKWSDQIEEELKKRGFKYNARLDHTPTMFDIEKHDKEFYERNGRPQFSLYSGGDPVFESDVAEYRIKVKMFRPKNNDRLPWVE